MEEQEKRHTCINCKRKRNEFYMKQIKFKSWVLPNQEISTLHWVCKDRKYRYGSTCFEMIFNVQRSVTITAVDVCPERTKKIDQK